MHHTLTWSAVLLLAPLGAPHVHGAPQSDFERKAATLFTKQYSFHAWNESDHTVEGEDWSLPSWVQPAHYSGIQLGPKPVAAEFPGRIQHAVHASWRECEPTEGAFDFSGLRRELLQQSADGKYAVKMGLAASVWETRYFRACKTGPSKKPSRAPPRFGSSATASR